MRLVSIKHIMIKYERAGKREKLPPANGVSKNMKERVREKKREKISNLQRRLKVDKVHAAVKNTVKYGRY